MDPDSGFDSVADVGIDGGTVRAIQPDGRLDGTITVDAAGLVVAPGFIDILSYEPNPYGIWFKIADGVTTNLGLHGLRARAADFFAAYASDALRPPTHYGGAFSNPFARESLGSAWTTPRRPSRSTPWSRSATRTCAAATSRSTSNPSTRRASSTRRSRRSPRWRRITTCPPPFMPGSRTTSRRGRTPRRSKRSSGSRVTPVSRVHVEHIISTGGTYTMRQSLDTLEKARRAGLEVTACTYPYDYWATYLASTRFNDGWQERFHITYGDLAIVGSGERLTASTFATYQAQNALCAAFAIPESDVRETLATDWIMLGSDAILEPGDKNHPRATGCFARAIGRYTRDRKVLPLMSALAKATILPARLVERGAPAMRRKGRLQLGADADITIFDPRPPRRPIDDRGARRRVRGRPVRARGGRDRAGPAGEPPRRAPWPRDHERLACGPERPALALSAPIDRDHIVGDAHVTEGSSRVRLGVIGVIVVALFSALFARLWFLQVATSESFAAETRANRIRVITEPGVRGRILDRDGAVIVEDKLVNSVQVRRGITKPERKVMVPRLAKVLGVTERYINARLDSIRYSPYQPVPIVDDVTLDTIVFLKERPELFPKVNAVRRSIRVYPNGSHRAPPPRLRRRDQRPRAEAPQAAGLRPRGGDRQGRRGADVRDAAAGLAPGAQARGRQPWAPRPGPERPAGERRQRRAAHDGPRHPARHRGLARAGDEVRERHQDRGASMRFETYKANGGAAVVLDARDGSVVALASAPDFDVREFTDGIPAEKYKALNSPDQQLSADRPGAPGPVRARLDVEAHHRDRRARDGHRHARGRHPGPGRDPLREPDLQERRRHPARRGGAPDRDRRLERRVLLHPGAPPVGDLRGRAREHEGREARLRDPERGAPVRVLQADARRARQRARRPHPRREVQEQVQQGQPRPVHPRLAAGRQHQPRGRSG